MTEQQEGRGPLGSRAEAAEHESQALIAADRQVGADHPPAQRPDNNISNLSDREIWRHFETTRGSAIFHLGRHLRNLKSWQRLRRAAPALESIQLDVVSRNSAPSLPREVWDVKVSRDNLVNQLQILRGLLDIMHTKAIKGLATSYCAVAFLAVVVGATASAFNHFGQVIWGLSTAALCASVGVVGLRTGRVACIRKCRQIVLRLYRQVQDGSLASADRSSLDGFAFRGLWWSSYLSTRKSSSDE